MFPQGSLKVMQHCLSAPQCCVILSFVLFCDKDHFCLRASFFCPLSLFSVSTPHTASSLLLCPLRPASALFTGKCHCSAWLEAIGPASCPFTSSWPCGESKTMAPLIHTGPLVYSAKWLIQSLQNNDDHALRLQRLHTAHCCHDTFLFNTKQESLITNAHKRIVAVHIQYFQQKHPFSVLVHEIERNTIRVLSDCLHTQPCVECRCSPVLVHGPQRNGQTWPLTLSHY